MIDRQLLLNCTDQDGLIVLLSTPENEGGLGWPVDRDAPFQVEPEIAEGVKGDGRVTVSRLIPPAADENRLVLLAEFDRPYIRRDLRELLTSLRRHIRSTGRFPDTTGFGDTVFIVASPTYEDIRFVLFEERERRLPRIRSFGWRREFVGRTVLTHNLERLCWCDRSDWESAWDVESLTEEFYTELVTVFEALKSATEHPGGDERRHAYVQQLLNRLLFIAFIERMGWLRLPIPGPSTPTTLGVGGPRFRLETDYLHTLWERHKTMKREGRTYQSLGISSHLAPQSFHSLLRNLFFNGLDDARGIANGHPIYPLLGEVPYLNGGLFTEEGDLDHALTTVDDDAFGLILDDRTGLFRRFNFTVTESTPLDQEVAVDPEMLGKIFERLINKEERHGTGAYYTPRPIVEFMVNEALKGYLTERGLPAEKAALLVDMDKVESETLSFLPSELQDALDWLYEVRAVDPACGSGAYLLMQLQRLFELVDRLEVSRDRRRDPNQKHLYNTKLRLLQRCVYGVDLNGIAVRIARLRLWLSLVVENRGEKPEPLPNFDFLIMCGDSLASPVKPDQHSLGYPHDAIREYTALKRKYFHPDPGAARPTRNEMSTKRDEIAAAFESDFANSRFRALAKSPFDWEVDFAEVFDSGRADADPGFDIVLANPPYVDSRQLLQEAGKAYKDALTAEFHLVGSGSTDLFVYFMDRAIELLRAGGTLAFITSNKWLRAKYGDKLKLRLASTTHLTDLIDFGDLHVFQGTIAYPMITIARKKPSIGPSTTRFVLVPSLDAPYPDVSETARVYGRELPEGAISAGGDWLLDVRDDGGRLAKMSQSGRRLSTYLTVRILSGIKTGLNDVRVDPDGRIYAKSDKAPRNAVREGVFVIDSQKRADLIAEDSRSAEIIRPLMVGRGLKRWASGNCDRWLITTKIGTDMSNYPAVMRHLERFKHKLMPRTDQGDHWWELRPCAYYGEFQKPKIVSSKLSLRPTFAFDDSGALTLNTSYIFVVGDPYYVLALLNSSVSAEWSEATFQGKQGAYEVQPEPLGTFPIPGANDLDRNTLRELAKAAVGATVENNVQEVARIEQEINQRVEFLYFHASEAPTYDEWVAKRVAEKGTAIEEVRNLIAAGESGTAEFKQSLEYVDPNHPDILKAPESTRAQRLSENRKSIVHSALKTVCAFLNSKGGSLLLGVHDTDGPVGIEPDYTLLGRKQDRDGFENRLTDLIKTRFKPIPANLDISFVEVDGKTVCRIDVPAERAPHYLDNKLYIRLGNSTEELTGRDLEDWLVARREHGPTDQIDT